MITIENGTFLIGVVLDCNFRTLEPEDVLGEYLGIYWNEKVWILDVKDNCNYGINTLFPFSPWHERYKGDKINKKMIPEKWLRKNLTRCGAIPLVEGALNVPPIVPKTFPRASLNLLLGLEVPDDNKRKCLAYKYNRYDYYNVTNIK